MGIKLLDNFINSYSREPKVIILDCDNTNTNTHGQQELSLFSHYYDEHCYMPLHIYESLSGKLITTILKPGRCSKKAETGNTKLKEKAEVTIKSDRASCNKFSANQFRLFLHSMAYVLIHTFQSEMLQGTEYATATIKTIREKILKTAAVVKKLKTRIKIEMPASCIKKKLQMSCYDYFALGYT